jgi:hypothetical protein
LAEKVTPSRGWVFGSQGHELAPETRLNTGVPYRGRSSRPQEVVADLVEAEVMSSSARVYGDGGGVFFRRGNRFALGEPCAVGVAASEPIPFTVAPISKPYSLLTVVSNSTTLVLEVVFSSV